ncbi:hypothetical protein THAOC_31734 [Thalassiosira oceanica]|uniref:Uncharacterized protein n=1 Tax=Thalassiosira oceanica TaxID=159749 RepID=K0RAQ0_THAOC|nr:hypothetical protein THAOC_31734 [Thalassiosira oceanica]|eukprot:EJK49399.1 hypothetical protein THAOC_31734 [Thalassiosira oceanica]
MPKVGQSRIVIVFCRDNDNEDRSARSVWKVALSNALGLENTELASGRPGKAPEARNRRNFDGRLRQKGPSIGKTRPAAPGKAVGGPNSTRGQNGTKSSFPESSRRALQVTVNRRIQVQSPPGGPRARGV